MIRHTVAFSLIHESGSSGEREFLDAAVATLTAIPVVQGFRVSRQISKKSSLNFQFEMKFDGAEAFNSYNDHPAHVGFVETRWAKEVSEFQELDFEPYDPEGR
ncbi:Dabb family protein [Arthrobacter sp. MI7-26]|uniref:Dabb family protein n=1 Tax=Arthrobacter sp. MI7-26 TaxID=2993653 RepID=UPI0022494A4D|nr:Dabb family protein [Arthrobacter sp. MI7-26]MCX2749569.1 Dabb family protein [Arthrobacter sp. MI7-26]